MDSLTNNDARPEHKKIVLLGKTGTGKSCLLQRFMQGTFSQEGQSNVGCAFVAKQVQVGKTSLCFGIWDTCGQEKYEALSRIYYQGASAAIICYDLTEESSYEKMQYWIEELQLNNHSQCDLYLTGTKLDLIEDAEVVRAIDANTVNDFAKDVNGHVFETSSKTGHNIDELFLAIANNFISRGLHRRSKPTSIRLHETSDAGETDRSNSKRSRCGACNRGGSRN